MVGNHINQLRTTFPVREASPEVPAGKSEPTGVWRQNGLLLYGLRTEFITGLGLQFCGFDGFRWGSLD